MVEMYFISLNRCELSLVNHVSHELVFYTVAPGSPPRNVRARPISTQTVVIEWEEPEKPNGFIQVMN